MFLALLNLDKLHQMWEISSTWLIAACYFLDSDLLESACQEPSVSSNWADLATAQANIRKAHRVTNKKLTS